MAREDMKEEEEEMEVEVEEEEEEMEEERGGGDGGGDGRGGGGWRVRRKSRATRLTAGQHTARQLKQTTVERIVPPKMAST